MTKPDRMYYAHLPPFDGEIERKVGAQEGKTPRQHSHYFKACKYRQIDVYRVIDIFQVTHPCAQHVLKKVLVPGSRGHKDLDRDIQDMIDTLLRWQEMRLEEAKP